ARYPHALRELPRPCGAGTGGATLTDGTTTGDGTGYGGAGDGGPAAAVGERSGMIRHRRIVTAGTDACSPPVGWTPSTDRLNRSSLTADAPEGELDEAEWVSQKSSRRSAMSRPQNPQN